MLRRHPRPGYGGGQIAVTGHRGRLNDQLRGGGDRRKGGRGVREGERMKTWRKGGAMETVMKTD